MERILSTFDIGEKKIIYVIFLIPIAILAGSLVINSLIIFIDIYFLYEIIKSKKYKYFKNFDFYLLILIYLYLIFNSIFIAKDASGFLRAFGFLRYVIFAFAIAYYLSIENSRYLKNIIKFWSIIFLISALDIIFESIFGFNFLGFKSEYPGRLGGFTGDEYKIGGYFFGFILLTLSLFTKNKSIFAFLLISFSLLAISFLTGERSNFIKIFALVFLFILFYEKKFFYKKILFFIALILSLILIFSILPKDNEFKQRFESRYISGIYEPIQNKGINNFFKQNEHFKIYNASIKIFLENKFFGVGIKRFRHESYREKYQNNNSQGSLHPHQVHFEFLSELGFVGYLLIMFLILKKIFDGLIFFKSKNDIFALSSTLFLLVTIFPLLPGGSFFTTFNASIFWLNFSIILRNLFINKD